jgi:hypothetical protein
VTIFQYYASNFELDGKAENPFHGGELALRSKVVSKGLSSQWNGPKTFYQEHKFHPFHPIAPALHHKKSTNPSGLAA